MYSTSQKFGHTFSFNWMRRCVQTFDWYCTYTPGYSALQRLSAVTTPTLKLRKRPSKFCIRWDFVVTANLTVISLKRDTVGPRVFVTNSHYIHVGSKLSFFLSASFWSFYPQSCHIPGIDLLPACTMGNKLGWLQTFPSCIVHRNAWNGCHIYTAPRGYRLRPTPTLHVHHRATRVKRLPSCVKGILPASHGSACDSC